MLCRLTFFVSLFAVYSAEDCNLPTDLIEEIHSYQNVVDDIIKAVVNGTYSGRFYNDLADFVDYFGSRVSGTDNLEAAINNTLDRMSAIGLEVSTDPVEIINWKRGEESAEMISPWKQKLTILGLGLSPGTEGDDGITAEVIAVKDFNELQEKSSQVPGKIVLFNAEYVSYGQTGKYRTNGPNEASKLGAVGVLVRSITPFSIDSPHTGLTDFDESTKPIPAAAITLEDSNELVRLIKSGKTVVVNLKMGASFGPQAISRNAMGDIPGSTKPEEYLTLSGHIDSWDVGTGAMDDGGGAFLAWHSLWLIKTLSLPSAKRTMRAILWTGEEQGIFGAKAYLKSRRSELDNWTAALESDVGVFHPLGLSFAGTPEATCIMTEILTLFKNMNATTLVPASSAGSDINTFQPVGVPLGEPYMVPNNYFWFHHSKGDRMDVLNSEDLDRCLALFAGVGYVLADLSIQLPRAAKETIK